MNKTANIGLIGLGVMGENLALNIERNGYTIAVFNRTKEKTEAFMANQAAGKNVIGCLDIKEFMDCLERPRKIILLVKAGDAVDETISHFQQYLQSGDIIIDAGNSHFKDTIRRENEWAKKGVRFIGSGVSGGEEGALKGPSLMPGGDKQAYEEIRPIWEAIAAKVNDGPCVTYLGTDGAGHFVKMVHNGIEYGDMQLIAEVYDVLRRGLGLSAQEVSETFAKWNQGILDSFLIEITANILSVLDSETGKAFVDQIVDKAGQKGTGKWTAEIALDLGIPIPTIEAALVARQLSALKDERVAAAAKLRPSSVKAGAANKEAIIAALHDALYSSKICSYAQGMALIAAGSKEYKWNINLAETARIWKGGCIIRARLLEQIRQAFARDSKLANLLLDPEFAQFQQQSDHNWRSAVCFAIEKQIPVPALSASLTYYDSYLSANLPQNLTQAQRDYFGAHTFEVVGKPSLGFIHADWKKMMQDQLKEKSSHEIETPMPTYSVNAINVGSFNLGEADKIITLFSAERGLIRAVAKAARKPGAKIGGRAELLAVNRLLIANGRTLDIITQAENIETFKGLRNDLTRLSYALYYAELTCHLGQGFSDETSVYFEMLLNALRQLCQEENNPAYLCLIFQLSLLDLLGLKPELDSCVICRRRLVEYDLAAFDHDLGGVICDRCFSSRVPGEKARSSGLKLAESSAVNVQIDQRANQQISSYFTHLTPLVWKKMILAGNGSMEAGVAGETGALTRAPTSRAPTKAPNEGQADSMEKAVIAARHLLETYIEHRSGRKMKALSLI